MYTCLNASITGWLPLAEWVHLAKRTGWQAVEVGIDEVAAIIKRDGIAAARTLFEESGVQPAVFGLPTDWRGDDAKFSDGLERLPAQAAAAAAIGCLRTATWVLPFVKDEPVEQYSRRIGERFRRIARILGEHGIRLGLEFIGPHHFLKEGAPFARAMDEMLQFESDFVGEPNMGLLLDSYHWYTTGGSPAQIAALRSEQIVHVHINDAKSLPVENLQDGDRLLHGEGVIDLPAFLAALNRCGYDGPVAPEPLGRKLAEEFGPEGAALKAREELDRLLEPTRT